MYTQRAEVNRLCLDILKYFIFFTRFIRIARILSVGRITLNSNDPLDPPFIWSNDFGTEHDRSVVIQGIQHIIKLSKAPIMQKLGLKRQPVNIPECSQHKPDSYAFWDCAVRWDTRPENHQTGTARMGPRSDPMTVVDTQLKVHGIKGLRIADASVIPRVRFPYFSLNYLRRFIHSIYFILIFSSNAFHRWFLVILLPRSTWSEKELQTLSSKTGESKYNGNINYEKKKLNYNGH